MDVDSGTGPVFTDDSGRRAAVVQWMARGVSLYLVLVVGTLALTLATRVSLPGLDRPLLPVIVGGLHDAAVGQLDGKTLSPASASAPDPVSYKGPVTESASGSTVTPSAVSSPSTSSSALTSASRASGSGAPLAQPTGTSTPNENAAQTANAPATAKSRNPNAAAKAPKPSATAKSPTTHPSNQTRTSNGVGEPPTAPPGQADR